MIIWTVLCREFHGLQYDLFNSWYTVMILEAKYNLIKVKIGVAFYSLTKNHSTFHWVSSHISSHYWNYTKHFFNGDLVLNYFEYITYSGFNVNYFCSIMGILESEPVVLRMHKLYIFIWIIHYSALYGWELTNYKKYT